MHALDVQIDSMLLGTILQISFKQPNTYAVLASLKKSHLQTTMPHWPMEPVMLALLAVQKPKRTRSSARCFRHIFLRKAGYFALYNGGRRFTVGEQ